MDKISAKGKSRQCFIIASELANIPELFDGDGTKK